jgi:HEAT repeat protein
MRLRGCHRALTLGLLASLAWLPGPAPQAQEPRYEERTLSDWTRLLEDPDPPTRVKAVEALRMGFGVEAVPALVHALGGAEPSVRYAAVQGLAAIRPPAAESIAALTKAMRDTDPAVRTAAAAALGEVGAVAALAEALKDPSRDVRRNAVRPLRRIISRPGNSADPATTRTVVAALADALKDTDPGIRRASASSLGAVGPTALDAVPALTEVTKDPDPSIRGVAIEALSRIGGPSVVPPLVQALKDPQTSSLAIRGLAALGPTARDAAPALIDYIKDGDKPSRPDAVTALAKAGLGVTEAVPALTRALNDRDADVRHAAVRALGMMGPAARSALPALRELQSQGRGTHSAEVEAAIRTIGRE